VIATRPLTNNEDWHIMKEGECVMFKLGEVVHQHIPEDVTAD
jgi:glutamine amidotransferase